MGVAVLGSGNFVLRGWSLRLGRRNVLLHLLTCIELEL